MPRSRKKSKSPKRNLAFPDLEQAKSAVLNTLTSKSGQRTYDHAITEFVEWYCSEPRLAFTRTVVLRYRISLEQRQYAPSTINLRLAAVKGVRRLGVRVGNWLTTEQGKRLLDATGADTLRGKRNRAMLSLLIGCGLRRAELLGLAMNSIQLRECPSREGMKRSVRGHLAWSENQGKSLGFWWDSIVRVKFQRPRVRPSRGPHLVLRGAIRIPKSSTLSVDELGGGKVGNIQSRRSAPAVRHWPRSTAAPTSTPDDLRRYT